MKGEVKVSVSVTNKGQRAGKETRNCLRSRRGRFAFTSGKTSATFCKDLAWIRDRVARSPSRCGQKILSFIGLNNKPMLEPGDFEVMVGGLTGKFTLQ